VEDNSHAGQGAVVLDIGGDVGALVVVMPASLAGEEIEARPVAGPALTLHLSGSRTPAADHDHGHGHGAAVGHDHGHDDGHGHGHGHDDGHGHAAVAGHGHSHGHSHGHGHGGGKLEHVAVLARPMPSGEWLHSAVFPALTAGTYELYQRPAGPVRLRVEVPGGAVADAVWP
jgi:hypothetical protein